MILKGRTTRMILAALVALSEGHSVTFVAFDMKRAVRIGRRAVSIAKALGIPCCNVRGSDSSLPRIRARAMDTPPSSPTLRAKVFVDHSATFERTLTPPSRTVHAFADGVSLSAALKVVDEEIAKDSA